MITVATDDVIINLNGHRVDGNGIAGASGLINIDGFSNVTVLGGIMADSVGSDYLIMAAARVTIENMKLIGTTNIVPRIIVDSSENVTLQALEIETGTAAGIAVENGAQNTVLRDILVTGDSAVPALITTTNTNGTAFNNVWCSGVTTGATTGIIATNDMNLSIEASLAEGLQTGYVLVSPNNFEIGTSMARSILPGGLGGFIVNGPSAQNGDIHDCTVIGANSVAYSVSNTVSNLVYRDCFAINASGGFACDTVQNCTWEECVVEKSGAFGFSLTSSQQLGLYNCRVHKCVATGYSGSSLFASDFVNCTAQAIGGGITLDASTVITISGCQLSQSTTTGIQLGSSPNCVIEDTIVNGTTTLGYFITSSSDGVTVENCRALNTAAGFTVNGSNSVVFKNCMADETNIGAGFSVTNAEEVVHDQSIALNCLGNGFEGISADDMLYTNCSASSGNNGFSLNATDRVLYCECAAQSNQVGQFVASDCTHTIIRECCIGNNFIEDIVNSAADTSIICLDDLFCAIGPIVPLHQADFAGPVTLSTPQHYKLCENITADTTITIASNDLIFDLGEFFMDGVSIIVNNNLSNVTIRNGQIRDVPFFIDIGTGTQNIIIENLVLDGITTSATPFGIRIAVGPAIGSISENSLSTIVHQLRYCSMVWQLPTSPLKGYNI